MIDALVEIGLDKLSDAFMADLVGPSALADRKGKIDVVPAFGRRSLKNPGEILGKISRAYAERVDHEGNVSTFLDKVGEITDYFSALERYDAILIDARAGLHETTASALPGLGAHVFLFGLDEPQTFHGYGALFPRRCQALEKRRDYPAVAMRCSCSEFSNEHREATAATSGGAAVLRFPAGAGGAQKR